MSQTNIKPSRAPGKITPTGGTENRAEFTIVWLSRPAVVRAFGFYRPQLGFQGASAQAADKSFFMLALFADLDALSGQFLGFLVGNEYVFPTGNHVLQLTGIFLGHGVKTSVVDFEVC